MPVVQSISGRVSTDGVESVGELFVSGDGEDAIQLYYELYGDLSKANDPATEKAIFLHGASFTGSDWNLQIEELLMPGVDGKSATKPIIICTVDNMGVGRSSAPKDKRVYQTTHMAHDVYALLEYLGWNQVHVVGFSLGAMIALKLAAKYPTIIASLTLISLNSGGIGSLPGGLSTALKLRTSGRTTDVTAKAKADLTLHFTPRHLKQWVPKAHRTLYELLLDEYVEVAKLRGRNTKDGTNGQMYAIMSHKFRPGEKSTIMAAKIPILFIHGMYDHVAKPKYAQSLAQQFGAPFILLDAAHMVTRECAAQVNILLHNMLFEKTGFADKNAVRFMLPMNFSKDQGWESETGSMAYEGSSDVHNMAPASDIGPVPQRQPEERGPGVQNNAALQDVALSPTQSEIGAEQGRSADYNPFSRPRTPVAAA